MECNFHIGQKVVCIDDEIDKYALQSEYIRWCGDLDGLEKGKVYNIRDISRQR